MPTKTASVLAKVSVLATARVMSLPESQHLKDLTEKRLAAYQRFAVAESAAHNLPRDQFPVNQSVVCDIYLYKYIGVNVLWCTGPYLLTVGEVGAALPVV